MVAIGATVIYDYDTWRVVGELLTTWQPALSEPQRVERGRPLRLLNLKRVLDWRHGGGIEYAWASEDRVTVVEVP